jgi:phosphate transport system substrate-binding protein
VTSPSGKAVHASEETVSAAAAAVKNVPDDLRFSITNADSETAYPVSSLTWILVYKEQPDANKGKALMDFLWWATHDGQSQAAPMHYAPLPRELLPKVEEKIRSVTAGGQQLVAQR